MFKFKMPIRNVDTDEYYTICHKDNNYRWYNLTKQEFMPEEKLSIVMKAMLEEARGNV